MENRAARYGTTIRQWRTGLQSTTVHVVEDGWFEWRLRAEDDAPSRIAPRLEPLDAWREIPVLAVARSDGTSLSYRVRGSNSLAQAFLNDPGEHLLAMLAHTGSALAAAHDVPITDGMPSWPSPPVLRVLNWMRNGNGPRGATRLHENMRTKLGERRCTLLRKWAENPPQDGHPDVLLHGSASPRSVVVEGRSAFELRLGADCTVGCRSWDIEWFLAALFELGADTTPAIGLESGVPYWQARDAFLSGYGRKLPPTGGPVAVLGVLVHAHDFASYVGWSDELDRYIEALAELVDEKGSQICASG